MDDNVVRLHRRSQADVLDRLHTLATDLLLSINVLRVGEMGPQLVTLDKAAELLAVGRTTIQELVDRGVLPVVAVTGRAVRVDMRDIEKYIVARRTRRGL